MERRDMTNYCKKTAAAGRREDTDRDCRGLTAYGTSSTAGRDSAGTIKKDFRHWQGSGLAAAPPGRGPSFINQTHGFIQLQCQCGAAPADSTWTLDGEVLIRGPRGPTRTPPSGAFVTTRPPN